MKVNIAIFFLVSFLMHSCANKVQIRNDLKIEFESINKEGVFAIFQNKVGKLQVYNMSGFKDSLYKVANTLDIFLSLVAIEEGSLDDENESINIQGKEVSLKEAFKENNQLFFQTLIKEKISRDVLKQQMEDLHYGKVFADKRINQNQMRISPDEQLGLIKKMFFNQLPFQERTTQIVKNMFFEEDEKKWEWHWKEASIGKENHWVVGWVIKNKQVAFFVLYVPKLPKEKEGSKTFTLSDFAKTLVKKVMD